MQLHTFFRSSASYRVRIALNLKGLRYESLAVHLSRGGGEQFGADFTALNPQQLVPVLLDKEVVLQQSLAIIEYLDETWPQPALLPPDPLGRAQVRALAQMIACDIHPINNLRVLNYLGSHFNADVGQRDRWYRHWVQLGLAAVEATLQRRTGEHRFCHGDTPGLADCCLIPQIFNAQRFDCDIAGVPTLMRIYDRCMALDAFQAASPNQQADAI